jgi:hypothetical protein
MLLLPVSALSARGQQATRKGFRPVRSADTFPPVTSFPVKTGKEADGLLAPSQLVLGVVVGKEARAYPISRLSSPADHIVNDTLGGRPIAVTFCNLCRDGIVYDRAAAGRVLTFAVSGELWDKNMVMEDRETGSKWVQITGQAEAGPLKGTSLAPLASVLTDWATWSKQHPGGSVALPGDGKNNIKATREQVLQHADRFVVGLTKGDRAAAWGLPLLLRRRVVNSRVGPQPVVVTFDRTSVTARAYGRSVGDRVLTFGQRHGKLTDRQTGSTWDAATGQSTAGPLRGTHLTPLPAVVVWQAAWLRFHPQGDLHTMH